MSMTDREFIEHNRKLSPGNLIAWERFSEALDRLEAAVEKGEKLCVQNGNLLMENQALVKANEDRDLTPEEAEAMVVKRFSKFAVTGFKSGMTEPYWICLTNGKMYEGNSFREIFALVDKAEKDAKEGC